MRDEQLYTVNIFKVILTIQKWKRINALFLPSSNLRMFWTSLNGSVISLDRNSKFQSALEIQLTLEFWNEGFIAMN